MIYLRLSLANKYMTEWMEEEECFMEEQKKKQPVDMHRITTRTGLHTMEYCSLCGDANSENNSCGRVTGRTH